MTIETKRDMFERELQELYHAELEILDLHGDLAAAAASEDVKNIFDGHEDDTVAQIHRIEAIFDHLGQEPSERGSALMEGLLAEKDEFVSEVATDELRDLDVLSIGIINERIEITLLDRLIMLADDLSLPESVATSVTENRDEAKAALGRMQTIIDEKRDP